MAAVSQIRFLVGMTRGKGNRRDRRRPESEEEKEEDVEKEVKQLKQRWERKWVTEHELAERNVGDCEVDNNPSEYF